MAHAVGTLRKPRPISWLVIRGVLRGREIWSGFLKQEGNLGKEEYIWVKVWKQEAMYSEDAECMEGKMWQIWRELWRGRDSGGDGKTKGVKDGRLEEWGDISEVSGKGSGLGKKTAGLDLDMLTYPSENGREGLKIWGLELPRGIEEV